MSSAEDPKTVELTPAQCVAIEKLVAGATTVEAAAAADVDRTTVWRWMKSPEFKKVLIDRRNDVVEGVRAETAGLLSAAVDTYRKAMAGGEVSTAAYKAASDVLRAARVIGDNVTQAIPDDVIVEFANPNPDETNGTNPAPSDERPAASNPVPGA